MADIALVLRQSLGFIGFSKVQKSMDFWRISSILVAIFVVFSSVLHSWFVTLAVSGFRNV